MTVEDFFTQLRNFEKNHPSDMVIRENEIDSDVIYNGVVRSVYEILIDGDLRQYRGYICAKYTQNGKAELYVADSPSIGDLCVRCVRMSNGVIIIDVVSKS